MSEMALNLIRKAKAEKSKTLDLGNCGIVGAVPEEVGELLYLETLILSNAWWDEMARAPKSSKNNGSYNEIDALATAMPPYLTRLIAQGLGLATLRGLASLAYLRTLNFMQNKVADISPVAALANLTTLDLSHNQVADIRPVAALANLISLGLRNNQVADISPVAALAKLSRVNLYGNKVTDLGPLTQLGELKYLNLFGNKVVDILPLSNLQKLTHLNLNNTLVAEIAPLRQFINDGLKVQLDVYDESRGIFLRDCPLTNPPVEIVAQGNAAILKYWDQMEAEKALKGGPYINRDVKLVLLGNSDAGKSTLRIYLKEKRHSKSHASTHGMETTSWVPDFELDRLKSKGKSGSGKFTVRLIDFGGQEYYHDTHHMFFTGNTAYFLLWDKQGNRFGEVEVDQIVVENEKPERVMLQNYPLEYWLDAVAHFCKEVKEEEDISPTKSGKPSKRTLPTRHRDGEPNEGENVSDIEFKSAHKIESEKIVAQSAQVLVIQNKVDRDKIQFLQQEELRQKFPLVFDFTSISLDETKKQRLEVLSLLLKEMLEQMPIVGATFPRSFGIVKEALEAFKDLEHEMSREAFGKWANEAVKRATKQHKNYLDSAWINIMIVLFRQVGLVLCFPEATDASLRDKVFLRPDLLTSRIYTVMRGLTKTEGRFDHEHCWEALGLNKAKDETLLQPEEVKAETETLLRLMRQFRLVFFEGGNDKRFVAPLYLPKEPIQGVKLFLPLFHKATYRILYAGFIHKSVILHFFEAFGKWALKEPNPSGKDFYYYWRTGIVIRNPTEAQDAKNPTLVLLQLSFGVEEEKKPGTYKPAHIDLIPLAGKPNKIFTQSILDKLAEVNKGWNTTVQVSANGADFVDLAVVKKNAGEDPELQPGDPKPKPQFTFIHKEKLYQLTDFREFIDIKFAMKKIFISYSKSDTAHLQALEAHLSVFKRNGLISTWNCRKLVAGEKWDGKIQQELEDADIILFLVSSDFLATDYIWDVEIKRAVERDLEETAKVVPIIVRACVWEDSPLGIYNSPEKAMVVSQASNIDEAWTKIVRALEVIIKK